MIRIVLGIFTLVLIMAGLGMAAVGWMKDYGEQSAGSIALGTPMQADGLPYVDPDKLPRLYPVEDFAMFDQDGEVYGSENLAGHIWVGYMFFTSCPAQCPIMTENMKKVVAAVGDNENVYFTGVSVDPQNDTPERLTKYRSGYNIDNPRWHMVSGPMDLVQRIALDSFKLGSVDDPVFHSDKFVLVDGTGFVRGYFTGTDDADVRRLIEAIGTLLEESAA
ncbi:MAG: hypothetical protein GC168_07920 [Candidatus Hydrogenedens sp.]|nr:hypothetical protein [Candidatus Hydrogenedens sp.]